MKKLLTLTLAFTLILSLAACGGGKKDPVENNTPAKSATDVDFGAIMAGGAGNFTDLPPAERQALINAGKKEGVDVSFEPDGSVKFVDKEGVPVVQKPDGTWQIGGEDGIQAQVGGDWPDNEFTRLLPKPDFEVQIGISNDDSFTIAFTGTTIEQIKAYVEKIKAAGFTVGADTTDMEAAGMTVYNYNAKNAAGYSINVFSASDTMGLTIDRP